MSDGIQEFFGLHRRPFDKDLPDEALWLDTGRAEAVDRLTDAVTARQHALVLGEPGVGKNCVLRALKARLSPVHYRLTYIAQTGLGKRDFYRQICQTLDLGCKLMPASMYAAIQQSLAALAADRVHPVLVLDEAHLLPDDTLGTLHVLANFAWDAVPILSLVLVGLPELGDRLKLGVHRSLLTRMGTRVTLAPTTPEQTAIYVKRRLDDAGAKQDLFAPDALTVLHELSGGVLRSLDVLADHSLRLAAQQRCKLVDRAIVRRAIQLTPLA